MASQQGFIRVMAGVVVGTVTLMTLGLPASAAESSALREFAETLESAAPFAVGVAIDERETTGDAAAVVLREFDQITAENHMKPDAWYGPDRELRIDPQAAAIMAFARDNGLRVYGHTLAWHAQTPDWFFEDDAGEPLTDAAADQAVLKERLRTHIFGVAETLAGDYGPFGGGNPVVAFDVVNEVIDDGDAHSDGLRRSEWHRILGEEFVDLAFRYADEAFNDVYAAPGTDRPVALFINEYGTEWAPKRARLAALVERLLERDVPVDGVGHQFHVGVDVPVSRLDAALTEFAGGGLVQSVTEFDAPAGSPVTPARLDHQGTYVHDAFAVFAAHADELFSVTVWGLTDDRSWRSAEGAPVLFDASLTAKPAYDGALEALAAASAIELNVETSLVSRCVAGKVVLATLVTNANDVPVQATISSGYGSRSVPLEPGRTATVAHTTRQAVIDAGSVTVVIAGDIDDRHLTASFAAPHEAAHCES